MSISARIIARLDFKGDALIKPVMFDGLRSLGPVEEYAKAYNSAGIDEVYLQDCVASLFGNSINLNTIKSVADKIKVPLAYGGAIKTLDDVSSVLCAGADKIVLNSAAVRTPHLIKDAANLIGSQSVCVAIDCAKTSTGDYEVWIDNGKTPTDLEPVAWASQAQELGAGELYLSVINRDGIGSGFDLELIEKISRIAKVPVVACSGAGSFKHVSDLFSKSAHIQAVAIGSMFHYHCLDHEPRIKDALKNKNFSIEIGNFTYALDGYCGIRKHLVETCSIPELKKHLAESGFQVRENKMMSLGD